jgi:membrane-bound lytic murein transglycosylase F
VDDKRGTTALMQAVIDGKLDIPSLIRSPSACSSASPGWPSPSISATNSRSPGLEKGEDNSLPAAMLDFFNNINEDGTLARLEEKYLGHGNDFDTLTPAPSCAPWRASPGPAADV